MKTTATIEMKSENTMRMISMTQVMNRMGEAILKSWLVRAFTALVSFILGEEVSVFKALHLMNAMVAATSALLFGGFSWMVQALLLVWLGVSLWQCMKDNWK